MNFVINPPFNYCLWITQANKSSSPDEGVVEDEDVETQIRNGHSENNRTLKKKTQKCSKYEHVMLFVLHKYQTSYAKIVIRIEIFLSVSTSCFHKQYNDSWSDWVRDSNKCFFILYFFLYLSWISSVTQLFHHRLNDWSSLYIFKHMYYNILQNNVTVHHCFL